MQYVWGRCVCQVGRLHSQSLNDTQAFRMANPAPEVRNRWPFGTVRAGNIAHPPAAVSSRGGPLIPASLRHDMIRDAAYFRAQARGFVPGKEIEDWLAAEQDIEELIMRRYGR